MTKLTLALLSACFVSAVHADANAACGKVEVAKGDVKIKSGSKLASLSEGSKICSGDTIITAADSRAKLKMADGNELNVSPNSQIVLENYEYKPADNKKKVLLNVLKGKVRAATQKENMYNDKAKDGQANSFQVRTKSAVAGVRGTDFLTGYDPSSNKMEVVTFKGKVEVGQIGPSGQILNPISVMAGQRTEAILGQPPAPPKVIPAQELDNVNTESKAETAPEVSSDAGTPPAGTSGAEPKDEPPAANDSKQAAGSGSGEPAAGAPPAAGPKNGGSAGAQSAPPPRQDPVRESQPRLPSSAPTAGGAMMPAPMPAPTMPISSLPVVPVVPNVPNLPTLPVCDYCNRAIEGGPARVNVTVEIQQ